jgi:sugar lactone lactonase YvrE
MIRTAFDKFVLGDASLFATAFACAGACLLFLISLGGGVAHAEPRFSPDEIAGSRAGELDRSGRFFGTVTSQEPGARAVVGAMVTFGHGDPGHYLTVFTDELGRFVSPPLPENDAYSVRVRRIGWEDARLEGLRPSERDPLHVSMVRHATAEAIAGQLPANIWYERVLSRIEDPSERAEFKQQCTYCHQQGNWATRRPRTHEQWEKLILLMGTRGAMISRSLRNRLPEILIEAYEPDRAVAELVGEDFDPHAYGQPSAVARRAVIEEWPLGGRASMQHDVMVHPDGRLYSVDGPQDQLHRLDLSGPAPLRESWTFPHGDLPLGGVFATSSREEAAANKYVAPHSLQTAPDGSIWITLASGNQLARFDVQDETFEIHEVERGIYPHTLRFDSGGRIWYTMAATNHVGFFDPETKEQRHIRLPARNWSQALILRMTPFFLRVGRVIDIRGAAAAGDGIKMPVPYGIDIAPDGGVWFSQLNEHKIGRIDPDTFEYEMIATPFETPRRLRFDSKGGLWIPSFSESLLAHYDLASGVFRTWPIPIEPLGTETPYALAVEPGTDHVWICGTNSDTMIRFDPVAESFTVYPLPTRVTFTREVDFDTEGRVWTSNSNAPTWQIEGGVPKVIRIDPMGGVLPAESGLFGIAASGSDSSVNAAGH